MTLISIVAWEEVFYNDIGKGEADGSKKDAWKYLFDKHKDVTSSILEAGVFRYRFSKKELDKLIEKVNNGNYKEVVYTIQKRQLHLQYAQFAMGVALSGASTCMVSSSFVWPATILSTPEEALAAACITILVGLLLLGGGIFVTFNAFSKLDDIKTSQHKETVTCVS
ncbi:hypothetical protein [Wolbachia endosymbiont of Ctenocephalides felis wCfeT]|uniref:hypothetical protein n=1 Tax=Wolbachia endosymbiont of Ctenocephalides felis wCfeT TaxID=2732593 RepID=UPI0014451239|nr:hypothetical protein [Wolbachia endosymbiont of Ctenocephalides felis wCfeT]